LSECRACFDDGYTCRQTARATNKQLPPKDILLLRSIFLISCRSIEFMMAATRPGGGR
jgi:hypothetical protein